MKGTTKNQAASGTSETLTIDNSDCHVAHSAIPVNATYSISNNTDWSGMSINSGSNITTTQAGYLYYMYNDGQNKLIAKTNKPTVTWNTSSATIKPGAASSSIKATVSGNTGANRSSTVKYFYTADGTTFYTFDPANTSSFAPGTYTIYAAAYDTKIYVAAATTGTLTVLPKLASKLDIEADPDTLTAEGQSSTITVTASDLVSGQNNLTYTLYKKGTSSDTKVAEKEVTNGANTATFTVTPNARSTDYYATVAPTAGTTSYDAVQSGTVTISNTDEQYVPTYTVTFSSSNTTYGTVTAKSTYKGTTTTLNSGDSVKEGASVTFTATPVGSGTFVKWDNFDTTATTVTRVIRAATTVQGVFGKKGYQIGYINTGNGNKPDWLGDMKELPNGTYITSTAQKETTTFTIKRNYDGKFSSAGAGYNTYWLALGDKATPKSWKQQASMTATTDYYYVNVKAGAYVVYDPATDQVWLTSEPDDLYGVKVIAKDGTIRYGFSEADKYTSAFGDTTLTVKDGEGNNIAVTTTEYDGNADTVNLTAAQVRKGITLKVVTQVDQAHLAKGYYVKGFVVSGYEESFSVLMQDFDGSGEVTPTAVKNRIDSGYNEFELTLDTYPAKNIEITPVYAIKETTAGTNIRFYVDGFAGDVYKSWDGVIAVDAYNTSGDPVLGEYPGQPMINYNGRYMVDLPRSGVTGITLNNYVWDRVHSNLFYGTSGTDTPDTNNTYLQKIQAANKQTYDFNDFVYLKQVMDNDHEDEDIIFSFRHKYDENHNTVENSNLGQSTYYVDTTGGSTETTPFDYRNGFKKINPNDSIYQWENLTDFYDNRVDIFGDKIDIKNENGEATNQKAAYDNPIRIVSNGYDYSKAGKYATAWAVYAPVDASGNAAYTGAYDHYELVDVFGGQGNVVNNVGTFDSSAYLINPTHQLNLRDKYDEAYHNNGQHSPVANFVYDMAMIPTVISYEYAVYRNKSNLNLEQAGSGATDGNPGLRSDGRWFTTTSDQFLTAHTVVEYAEKDDDSLYHRDFFQSGGIDYTSGSEYNKTVNTGLSTGIKAYFENDDSDDGVASKTGVAYQNTPGHTEAHAVSDGEHTFNLKTVGDTNGDYVFKGWYLYSNGKYTFITRDSSYKSEATANDVYVARYYKVPSGNLQITHTLHPDSTGKANCYAKVEVMNGNNPVFTYSETTETIKVTPTYMKDNSENTLRITLRTECSDKESFEKFYDNVSGTIQELAVREVLNSVSDITKSGNQASVVITTKAIKNFFTNGEQTVKSLPFYSKLGVNLVITHKLDRINSTANADGDTFVRVEVLEGNSVVASYPSAVATDYADQDDDIVIPNNYFFSGSQYKLKVYLKTVAKGYSQFDHFSILDQTLSNNSGTNQETISIPNFDNAHRTQTGTIEFSISRLFEGGLPLVQELPYLSTLVIPDYTYTIKYNYPSYTQKDVYQTYTVKGVFNPDTDFDSVVHLDGEGLLDFVDTNAKSNFVNKNAPYEDNFQKKISISSSTRSNHTATDITTDVIMDADNETLKVRFNLPYDYVAGSGDVYSPAASAENKVIMTTDGNDEISYRTVEEDVYARTWFTIDGAHRLPYDVSTDSTKAKFVVAPLIVYKGETPMYFQYWQVKTVKKYNSDSREYTRCYDPQFNLAIFQDCDITPIYNDVITFEKRGMVNPPTSWEYDPNNSRFDPVATRTYYKNEYNGVTISFIENSRNQYNNGDYGTKVELDQNNRYVKMLTCKGSTPASRQGAADRIYSDFLLTFDDPVLTNGGKIIFKNDESIAENTYQAGLIIQSVAALETDNDGNYIIESDYSAYATKTGYEGLTPDQVKAALEDGNLPSGVVRSKFDVKSLDNKNRIQYYFGLNNAAPKSAANVTEWQNAGENGLLNVGDAYTSKTKVFKAFAYIGSGSASDNILSDVKVSQIPVYFTIYDDATIQPGEWLTINSSASGN